MHPERLPPGVLLQGSPAFRDPRGHLAELFRASWEGGFAAAQININHSEARVFRGVRCHLRHTDCLAVLSGRMVVGVRDLRRGTPAFGTVAVIELSPQGPAAVVIPAGVAHGLYFPEPTDHLYIVSREFDPADELSCRWNDPALEIRWPDPAPVLSARDAALGDLDSLLGALPARWPA